MCKILHESLLKNFKLHGLKLIRTEFGSVKGKRLSFAKQNVMLDRSNEISSGWCAYSELYFIVHVLNCENKHKKAIKAPQRNFYMKANPLHALHSVMPVADLLPESYNLVSPLEKKTRKKSAIIWKSQKWKTSNLQREGR